MRFFFFKQKTAYAMRISDWSSDVCSSDLLRFAGSRALARPSLADSRNYFQASFDGNTLQLATTRGNPYLKPAISDQFDITAEWYFARVGSLTIDGFYKKIGRAHV